MTFRRGFFLLFLLADLLCFGQSIELRPDFASQNQMVFAFNPSTSFSKNAPRVDLAFRNRFQDFAAIRSFYSLVTLPINKRQTTFFEVVSDQLGPHFQKNRLYLGYAIAVQLNENLMANFGASGGVINYNMTPNTGGAGGSDFVADGNVGLSLEHSSGVGLGFSLQQFLNREIQPMEYSFIIGRFSEVQLSYKKDLNEQIKLTTLARAMSFGEFALYSRMSWYDKMSLGVNYNSRNKMAAIAGYQMRYNEKLNIGLDVAYTFSLSALDIDKQTIEFLISVVKI